MAVKNLGPTDDYAESTNTGTVLIDLYQEGCQPCKLLEPVLTKLSEEFEGVVFVKVDLDLFMQETSGLGIQGVPTLILLKDGKEVGRKVGLYPAPALKEWLSENA